MSYSNNNSHLKRRAEDIKKRREEKIKEIFGEIPDKFKTVEKDDIDDN